LLFLALAHTVIRLVRRYHKFPIPHFLASAIDNPLRRRIQPPDKTPARHGIEPGMTVLDVGPGNGRYTVATAHHVGEGGKVIAVDIEPRMIERVTRRAQAEGITNIAARVADVDKLPFKEGTFDNIYLIAVIGEIPSPENALREFARVLSPSGTLAISELFLDPDYSRACTLTQIGTQAGFRLIRKLGNFFYYTLIFEKN
jgi:ubiquinone/menaquinone biosynthesis C-methylase UbiE